MNSKKFIDSHPPQSLNNNSRRPCSIISIKPRCRIFNEQHRRLFLKSNFIFFLYNLLFRRISLNLNEFFLNEQKFYRIFFKTPTKPAQLLYIEPKIIITNNIFFSILYYFCILLIYFKFLVNIFCK